MKTRTRLVILFFGLALWGASCSLSTGPASPGIPVTGPTLPPVTPPSTSVPALAPVRGSALAFDGRDDYIWVKDSPSLDMQNSFTIAGWIYLEEYTEWASIVTKGNKPNVNNYAMQQSGPFDPVYRTEFGKLRFSGCVGLPAPLPESVTVIPLQSWHFVALTFDGASIRFYLDGREDGSASVPGPLCMNDEPLFIGVDLPLATEFWHGAIDELGIWNVVLSESQVTDVMNGSQANLDSALAGYWSFDEGSGSTALDRSPHANNGILVGDPVWIQP